MPPGRAQEWRWTCADGLQVSLGTVKGWEGSMGPLSQQPGQQWPVASREQATGRTWVRATMQMPQVGLMARSPGLDSEKGFQAKPGKGSWGHWSQFQDQLPP